MFIFTAKFNKKRAITAVIALAVILAAIVILAGARSRANSGSGGTAAASAVVRDNAERVAYLKKLGWAVEDTALDEQAVTIPREFTEVYTRYNEIQTAQGFDLTKYGGAEAVRYTYRVTNHPVGDANAVADIIVYNNEIIAGDVQSVKLDGFMQGLAFPGT